MALRVHLKIKVMQNTYDLPEILLVLIPQLSRKIAQCFADDLGVFQMKFILIVFL